MALCLVALADLTVEWERNWLTIRGEIPGGSIRIHYLEAYCRPGSTDADWGKHTVIGHETRLVASDGNTLRLQCTLKDGALVDHLITAGRDEIDFRLTAKNPTDVESRAHWAQPCVRLGDFTGFGPARTKDDYAYLAKCFVFLDGKLERMPTRGWATRARYVPGQVWVPKNVPRDDVNPRPVNPIPPSNGLIGCFSADEQTIFATAWEPYQELFQGVGRCLHSDFRIGGLEPGETKKIRGKIYILPADLPGLVKRYKSDFPEQR